MAIIASELSLVPPAVWGAIIATCLGFFLNRKFQRTDLIIKEQNIELSKLNAVIAEKALGYKEVELRNAATFRAAETLLARHQSLRSDLSGILTLLEIYYGWSGPFPPEVQEKALGLCNSVAMYLMPRGSI